MLRFIEIIYSAYWSEKLPSVEDVKLVDRKAFKLYLLFKLTSNSPEVHSMYFMPSDSFKYNIDRPKKFLVCNIYAKQVNGIHT